jgi:hypothetical protein
MLADTLDLQRLVGDAKICAKGEVMMTPAETSHFASNLDSLGAFLDNGFIGTLRVKVAGENPDGSDVEFPITYPDWKNIGSSR